MAVAAGVVGMAGSVMGGRSDLDFFWVLAVDFGTTATAAAVREPDGRVAGLVLPDGTSTMPSSVLADPTGVLVGTKADNAAGYGLDSYQPTPKRDVGRASVLLGTTEFRPCVLIAAVYAAIIGEAVRQHNYRPPAQLVLTHPVEWSDRRLEVLREAVSLAGGQLGIALPDPVFVPEPVAAATHYAQGFDQPTARITTTSATVSAPAPSEEVGGEEYFAVYDLGGGTFDATVLCRSSDGFEVLATGGIDPLGGFEFDNRLFTYLGQTHYQKADPKLWQALAHPDPEDPDSGMRRRFLDAAVRQLKEELSEHTQRTVRLPGLAEPVLVTRAEFENLIRADLDATIAELEATLARAGLTTDQLAGIYRIGGASRIPLVGSLLDQIRRPVYVVDHPKTVVALGAAVDTARPVELEVAGRAADGGAARAADGTACHRAGFGRGRGGGEETTTAADRCCGGSGGGRGRRGDRVAGVRQGLERRPADAYLGSGVDSVDNPNGLSECRDRPAQTVRPRPLQPGVVQAGAGRQRCEGIDHVCREAGQRWTACPVLFVHVGREPPVFRLGQNEPVRRDELPG